jgi:6-phosphogluconolactonase
MDAASGTFSQPVLAVDETVSGFLAVSHDGRFLYAVAPVIGTPAGAIRAFSINPQTGDLTTLNQQPFGASPAYVSLDAGSQHAFVADYGGANIGVFPITPDGRLGKPTAVIKHQGSGPDRTRQEGPHPHGIDLSPDGKLLLACDLGLDKIMEYRFSAADGTLSPNDPPFTKVAPGAGPRHLVFHPNGRFAYVVSEMTPSVTVFAFDPSSGLGKKPLQTMPTLPSGISGTAYTGSEIKFYPNGRFLYVSNRGYDTIASFTVDANTGLLTPLSLVSTQGKVPRHFAIDPTARFLLAENQLSDNVVVFTINDKTGALTPTGSTLKALSPFCAVFAPSLSGQ